MALIGNYSTVNKTPGRLFGGLEAQHRSNWTKSNSFQNFAYQSGSTNALHFVSVPPGAEPPYIWDLPLYRGAMSSRNICLGAATGTGAIAGGRNIAGQADGAATGTATAKLLLWASGAATGAATGAGTVSGAVSGSGAAYGAATGSGVKGALAWLSGIAKGSTTATGTAGAASPLLGDAYGAATGSGTGTLLGILAGLASGQATGSGTAVPVRNGAGTAHGSSSATGDVRGLGHLTGAAVGVASGSLTSYALGNMAGAVTPFTELSPQNLAAELWNSLAAEYQADGTMGAKLNAAGSAGDPWTGNIEGVLTAKDALRILLSVAAGNTVITDNGNGTALVEFKSRDGATSRVSATMDGSERVNVIINTV